MRAMTVGKLIEALQEFDEEAEVRLAIQPSWPFEHSVSRPLASGTDDDGTEVVYIAESGQLAYLPGSVKEELGWS